MEVVSAIRLDALTPLDVSALPTEFRLFQYGDNPTSKGTFKLDEAGAVSVIDAYKQKGAELSIDYEHQALRTESNGASAPAAGWFVPEVRADGLWATNVRWTPRATEMLRNREYRYFSPAFKVDKEMRVTSLVNIALTNLPASEKQQALVAASEDVVALAVWSTAFIDSLPDSSFLYIEPGGTKDGEGKTTPRSLRHFPVKNANGAVDMPHLRNALARIPQSNVSAAAKAEATAKAKRMMGNQQQMGSLTMPNLNTIVGLKDDASAEDIEVRVVSLAALERNLLETTGAKDVASAMGIVIAAKNADTELKTARAALKEWEDRAAQVEAAEKQKQIESIIERAILDGRVSLKDTDRVEQLTRHGQTYGVQALEETVALMSPRPARVYQAPVPGASVVEQMKAIEAYKKEHPGATTADAYVALSQSNPGLFAQEGR